MQSNITKHYNELPKKYILMLRNSGAFSEFQFRDAIWSLPIVKDGYVYYVYETRVQGDCDKVYRFTYAEHAELLKQIAGDDVHGLDKSWIKDSCEPYIMTNPVR